MPQNPYPDAIEDTEDRPPEWEEIEPGYGQHPPMVKHFFDPVHGRTDKREGQIIQVHNPDRPA